jgi:exopolysaccharide biosynthesis polyprenyl glycosylphosphotransferase
MAMTPAVSGRTAARGTVAGSGRSGSVTLHAVGEQRWAWERRYVRTILALDVGAGWLAAATGYLTRFRPDVTQYTRWYAVLSVVLPLAWVGALALERAYESKYLFVGTDEYERVLRAGLGLAVASALVSYAFDLRLARSYLLVTVLLFTASSLVTRFGLRQWLHQSRADGQYMRRVLVVGHGGAVCALTRQLHREYYHGLNVVGACVPPADGRFGGELTLADQKLTVYGSFDDVASAVDRAMADTVVVLSCPELDGAALRRLAWQLEGDDIDLIVTSSLVDVAGARITIRPVDGLPLLHVEHPRLTGARRVAKTVFDRVTAALVVAALAPLFVLIALVIRCDSRGPALFRQVRVGKDGREFVMLKFRTMYADAERRLDEVAHLNENDGVLFKARNDPRVTRFGRWLRRFSLDELPQLLNVVRGEMSLVGPRPPLPYEVARYPSDMRRRLVVKPGVTGLWQVSGRADLSWEDAMRLDLHYVENWSFSFDLVILLRTVSAVLRASGAY